MRYFPATPRTKRRCGRFSSASSDNTARRADEAAGIAAHACKPMVAPRNPLSAACTVPAVKAELSK
jgi:hypothetical protein